MSQKQLARSGRKVRRCQRVHNSGFTNQTSSGFPWNEGDDIWSFIIIPNFFNFCHYAIQRCIDEGASNSHNVEALYTVSIMIENLWYRQLVTLCSPEASVRRRPRLEVKLKLAVLKLRPLKG